MLHGKRFKHWKMSLAAAVILLTGLVLAACVPADLTANVAKTSSDVAALKGDIAAVKGKIEELAKSGEEPKPIERESKDQVIRGRADLLDYRMDYDAFKKAILGTPAKKGQQGKPDTPAKPGVIGQEVAKLQTALAGTPAKKDAKTGKVTPAKPGIISSELSKLQQALAGTPATKADPAKPGLLPSRDDVAGVSKALADIKTQLDRIEAAQKAASEARAAAK